MRKIYEKVSIKSKYLNYLIRKSNAKKNYSNIENTKKFLKKYEKIKNNCKVYEKYLNKENYKDVELYSYNGTMEKNTGKILLYIHGGSFAEEAIGFQIKFAKKIAKKTNSTLIVPRYKLIPEGNYKLMYQKIEKLYKKIIKNCETINFLGDSSGGGFILGLSMKLRNKNEVLPKNILMLSPWIDLEMNNQELYEADKKDPMGGVDGNRYCGKLWANGTDVKNYLISPINGDFDNLPKITLATGEYDVLKPDIDKLDKKLTEKNIDHNYILYMKQGHDFGCFPSKEGIELCNDFINIINE